MIKLLWNIYITQKTRNLTRIPIFAMIEVRIMTSCLCCGMLILAEIEQGRIEPVISRDGIDSIILDEYYCTKTKQIDLCPKCRKDFEEFMRNDQN